MDKVRIAIFIDGQNLFHAARDHGDNGVEIGMENLVDELSGDNQLVRPYWFDSHHEEIRDNKKKFYTFLETNGFRVESLPLREHEGDLEEKGSDINLVSEMLHLAYIDAYDEAVLVSGDADFVPSIEKIQNQGKIVTVASFEKQLSFDLRKTADSSVILDDIVSIITRDSDSEDEPDEVEQELFLQIDED